MEMLKTEKLVSNGKFFNTLIQNGSKRLHSFVSRMYYYTNFPNKHQ